MMPHRTIRRDAARVFLTLGAFAALTFSAPSLGAQDQGPDDGPAPAPASAVGAATGTPAATPPQRTRRTRRARPRARAVAPAPRHTSPASAAALSSDIGTMLSSRVRSGDWGVMVVSLTRGDTLYARNADAMLMPASTMKLFTAALALDRFGPDHHFATEVLRDGPLVHGTLGGNLILRGDGDPAFSNRFLRGDADAPVDLLARFVAGAGVRRVRGDLIADASAFESRTIPEGWRSRYLGFGYAAPFSALSLNENVVTIAVEPGAAKTSAIVSLEPASSSVALTNLVTTRAGSRSGRIAVRRVANGGIEVRGWIGTLSNTRRYQVVVDNPPMFTAGAFRNALAKHGVTVDGEIRLGEAGPNAELVASLPSPPLARLVSVMNRESINLYAELLFRNAARGKSESAEGSAERGEELLTRFMTEKVGAAPGAVIAADGSGLSTLDRATPRSLVQLLSYAHSAPWSSAFHASLPVAGESELLRNRMRATPAQGNLHAKTGTTNDVISLAGYATARNGEVVAFAFVYNGSDRWNARSTIDQMGATLASFIRE